MTKRKTTAEFIDQARAIHGYKFGYSEVEYVRSKDKVIIICPDHGAFAQLPGTHTNPVGHGCPGCGRTASESAKWSNAERFIANAIITHGDKYNYSQVKYKGTSVKVSIICPEHGLFSQNPSNHMHGDGCPTCARKLMGNRLNQQEFIDRSTDVHNDFYDYSKVLYTHSHAKIIIICPTHGEFEQQAGPHMSGKGCSKCGYLKVSEGVRKSPETFITDAHAVHSDTYDYTETNYIGTHAKVSIICRTHGQFLQNPTDHLTGYGCPTCGAIATGRSHRSDTASFVDRATKIHHGKYDYSLVEYTTNSKKVPIICPVHGKFRKTPDKHLGGSGCPQCAPGMDNDLLYIHRADGLFHNGKQVYKIGVTSQRLSKTQRKSKLESALGSELVNVIYLPVKRGTATKHETWALRHGEQTEYPEFDGSTEYRALTPWQLQDIISELVVFRNN